MMQDDDIDALILELRERRQKPIKDYEAALRLKEEANYESLHEKATKTFAVTLSRLKKKIDRIDSDILAAEEYAKKLRVLRLEFDL